MSEARSIQSVRTTWPRMSRPRISPARSAASSGVAASLMPPALPRPPVSTCALTTTGPPISAAAACASLGRERDAPLRDGDAEAREQLLALVLVEIHLRRRLAGRAHGERRVHRARVRQRERRCVLGVLRLLQVRGGDHEAVAPGLEAGRRRTRTSPLAARPRRPPAVPSTRTTTSGMLTPLPRSATWKGSSPSAERPNFVLTCVIAGGVRSLTQSRSL